MRFRKREIPSQQLWILSAVVTAGIFLLLPRKPAVVASGPGADLDALASMLIAETGFERAKNEMAQIVFVAVNRARKYKSTIALIASPPGKPVAWNASAKYRDRFNNAPKNPRWAAARAFAADVLNGAYSNSGASAFVHPSGMPLPPCSSNRVATSTIAGTRCLPEWAVKGKVVGGAMFV